MHAWSAFRLTFGLFVRPMARLAVLPLAVLALSCGGGGGGNGAPKTPSTPQLTGPQGQTVLEGASVNLRVSATANGTLSYQWKKDGQDLSGKTTATLGFGAVALSDAGSYTVVVTNTLNGTTATATSSAATLTVNEAPTAPVFTTSPLPQTVTEGASVTLTALATGNGTLSYQWQKGGADLPGKTDPTLAFSSVALSDAGSYTVVATNAKNGATRTATSSAVVLTVNAAGSFAITVDPQPATVTVPDAATFTVTATGTGLSYAWYEGEGQNLTLIAGATGPSYTTPATFLDPAKNSYTYTVKVTCGSEVQSRTATLTVQQPDPCYAGDPEAVPTRTDLKTLEYAAFYSSCGAFRLAYDETLMDPLWSAYCTYRIETPLSFDNKDNYVADPRTTTQVGDGDFTRTGYSRGHMSVQADLGRRYGSPAALASCTTTNLCPQAMDHNNNLWNYLEQEVSGVWSGSAWTKPGLVGATNRLWITTGPVFTSGTLRRTVGDTGKGMAIPDGFYKVMVKEVAGKPKALAILTPHEPTPAYADIWKYVTSVARIEELTGLNLYPSLAGTAAEIAAFKAEVDVRNWGAPFARTDSKPNVHMVAPSWDAAPLGVNASFTFKGAATVSSGRISSTAWDFGDGASASGLEASHAYASNGTYTVTFTATTEGGQSTQITRTVEVTGGNSAPTVTGLPAAASTLVDTAKDLAFTVADDSTDVGSLVLAASSSDESKVPNSGLSITGTGASRTLHIVPAAGATGSLTLTLTVKDGDNATTTKTIPFNITSGSGSGQLIISQYYEGDTTASRFVELTNVGDAAMNLAAPQIYLLLYSNPNATTGNGCDTKTPSATALTGTLEPGQSILFMQDGSTDPDYAKQLATSGACSFNGNDVVALSTSNALGTGWTQRLDMIGLQDGTDWGKDRSFVRKGSIRTPNATYAPSEWDGYTCAQVKAAAPGNTERLGSHVTTH